MSTGLIAFKKAGNCEDAGIGVLPEAATEFNPGGRTQKRLESDGWKRIGPGDPGRRQLPTPVRLFPSAAAFPLPNLVHVHRTWPGGDERRGPAWVAWREQATAVEDWASIAEELLTREKRIKSDKHFVAQKWQETNQTICPRVCVGRH